jgi:hypothetical protein
MEIRPNPSENPMDPGPDLEAHHHDHTGHRWLDILLGVCAMVVSVVSLFVALHHGETMEKMVEASTWPYVDFSRSSSTPDAQPRADLMMTNSGVGPARLETVEVFYKGQSLASREALIEAVVGGDVPVKSVNSIVADRVLPAGGKIVFLSAVPDGSPGFSALRSRLDDISARICFCSVLEECWRRDSRQPKPEKLKACPKPAVAYAN